MTVAPATVESPAAMPEQSKRHGQHGYQHPLAPGEALRSASQDLAMGDPTSAAETVLRPPKVSRRTLRRCRDPTATILSRHALPATRPRRCVESQPALEREKQTKSVESWRICVGHGPGPRQRGCPLRESSLPRTSWCVGRGLLHSRRSAVNEDTSSGAESSSSRSFASLDITKVSHPPAQTAFELHAHTWELRKPHM